MSKLNDKYYHILTYGCQMNEHDSEKLAGMLEEIGYQAVDQINKADLILFNTCCIRENAELKVYGKIGALKKLKEEKPDLIIGVGGCMMQSGKAVKELYQKYPQVDLIFGTHNIHYLPELIKKIAKENNRVIEVWDKEKGLIPDLPSKREGDHKAWVSIIQGCNNFCTYCIVPYVRGRERSRPFIDIINEVKTLVQQGVKEITLLGQNVNSYGQDLADKKDFADLLSELNSIEKLARIRYMTSHPRDFKNKLIETIKNNKKVCEHFHLPIQSGSTRILKKMNRGYTQKEYLKLTDEIKKAIPNASITTDIIVGFPGETEADFQETLKVVKEVKFDMAFTFLYSQRTGTPAAKIKEQVSKQLKKERLQKLNNIQNNISLENNQKLLNKNIEVLVEGESKNDPEMLMGRSKTNKLIIFPKKEGIIGELVNIKIDKVQSFTLYGEVT